MSNPTKRFYFHKRTISRYHWPINIKDKSTLFLFPTLAYLHTMNTTDWGVEEKDRGRGQWVSASKEDIKQKRRQALWKLTGLGIASGSILCLDFWTAGMSDACFTFKSLSSKYCKTNKMNKYKECEDKKCEKRKINKTVLSSRQRCCYSVRNWSLVSITD